MTLPIWFGWDLDESVCWLKDIREARRRAEKYLSEGRSDCDLEISTIIAWMSRRTEILFNFILLLFILRCVWLNRPCSQILFLHPELNAWSIIKIPKWNSVRLWGVCAATEWHLQILSEQVLGEIKPVELVRRPKNRFWMYARH